MCLRLAYCSERLCRTSESICRSREGALLVSDAQMQVARLCRRRERRSCNTRRKKKPLPKRLGHVRSSGDFAIGTEHASYSAVPRGPATL